MLNTTLGDYVLSRYILHLKGQDRFDIVKMKGGGGRGILEIYLGLI